MCSGDGLSTTTVRICPHDCQPFSDSALNISELTKTSDFGFGITRTKQNEADSSTKCRQTAPRDSLRVLNLFKAWTARKSRRDSEMTQCLHRQFTLLTLAAPLQSPFSPTRFTSLRDMVSTKDLVLVAARISQGKKRGAGKKRARLWASGFNIEAMAVYRQLYFL